MKEDCSTCSNRYLCSVACELHCLSKGRLLYSRDRAKENSNSWAEDIERIEQEGKENNKKEWKFCPHCGERL